MLTRYHIVILLGGIALVVLIGAGVSTFLGSRSGSDNRERTRSTAARSPEGGNVIPYSAPPEGQTIVVNTPNGGVRVRNFYRNAISKDEGVYLFIQSEEHEIAFDSTEGVFFAVVRQEPFAVRRQVAEQVLMQWLGIDQGDACKLTLRLWKDGRYEGSGSPFDPLDWSFCSGI